MPLQPPPRDEQGNVTPHDHPGIEPEDGVIRRVSPKLHVVWDPKIGGNRLSSIAFKPSSDSGMSVDLERQILDAGLDVHHYVTTPTYTGSLRFQVGALRGKSFQVGFDPTTDNPYHGQVWFARSKANEKTLRTLCEWFVKLDGVAIETP